MVWEKVEGWIFSKDDVSGKFMFWESYSEDI